MIRRPGACAIAFGVVLAACSGSTKTSNSPATSATVATTTMIALTTTSAKTNYGRIYLGLVAPVNAATDTFDVAGTKLGNNPTAAAVQQIATPFAAALTAFDSKVLRVKWPASVASDVKGVVLADGAFIGDLDSASAQNAVTAASWVSAISADGEKASTASNIVRADLGLPPPKP